MTRRRVCHNRGGYARRIAPELTHLRSFVALADTLHFGRAAELLGVTPSALSQQLGRLEAELGLSLFDRTTRRMALTDAGEALLPEAERAVALLADAEDAASRAGQAAKAAAGPPPEIR